MLVPQGWSGFIFEQGSVLAHLAVVLRENGIPAIALDDSEIFASLRINSMAEIDAFTCLINASHRITYQGLENG